MINPTFVVALMKEDAMTSRVSEMKCLKLLTLIGSPISDPLCAEFARFWKRMVRTNIEIRFAYGMTESVQANPLREISPCTHRVPGLLEV